MQKCDQQRVMPNSTISRCLGDKGWCRKTVHFFGNI